MKRELDRLIAPDGGAGDLALFYMGALGGRRWVEIVRLGRDGRLPVASLTLSVIELLELAEILPQVAEEVRDFQAGRSRPWPQGLEFLPEEAQP